MHSMSDLSCVMVKLRGEYPIAKYLEKKCTLSKGIYINI